MAVQIRRATEADAAGAVEAIRRSITDLCDADHRSDGSVLEAWLRNKTVEAWLRWIARTDAVVLVAERHRVIVGVGMATDTGEILLNYVHPDARFCDVSKAMLAALEDWMRLLGLQHCQLESTLTARRLYASCGFLPEPSNPLLLAKSLQG